MWGSPGTILVGRELGLDVDEAVDWLRAQRAPDGLWMQDLYGSQRRHIGPAHGFAGCALALADGEGVSDVLRRYAIVEDGLINWPPVADEPLRHGRTQLIRTQWCHGAPGIVSTRRPLARRGSRARRRRAHLARRAAPQRAGALPRHGGQRLRAARAVRADGRRAVACARPRVRDARARPGRAHAHGVRAWSLHALDGRRRHGSLSRGLPRRNAEAAAAVSRR